MAKLTASDAAAGDEFGVCVSVSGDLAVVGAPYDDDSGSGFGSAYIFQRDEGGPDNWGQVTKLTAIDGAPTDSFGFSVSIRGDLAIIGAVGDQYGSGSAYIFRRDEPSQLDAVQKRAGISVARASEAGFVPWSSRTGGFTAESAMPAWIEEAPCGRMMFRSLANGESRLKTLQGVAIRDVNPVS